MVKENFEGKWRFEVGRLIRWRVFNSCPALLLGNDGLSIVYY